MTLRARFGRGVIGALAMLALSSCGEPAAPRRPVVLTASDLAALSLQPNPPHSIVDGYGLPGGMRLDRIVVPAPDTGAQLVKRVTWTEEYRSAYVTTEVWAGFDEVWIQPVYVPVTGYDDEGRPQRAKSESSNAWRPVFGVGPDSAFYSPYWRVVYFQTNGHPVDSFNSVRDVYARGVDLRPGEGHVMVLAPKSVAPPTPIIMPTNGEQQVGGPTSGAGVLDGEPAPFLDFGIGTFTWNDDLVVEEAPIFVWVVRDDKGVLRQLDLPTVAGTGPLYANRPAKLEGLQPRYGSYWRIYTVEIPRDARVFAPDPYKELQDGMDALGVGYLYTLGYDPSLRTADPNTWAAWAGRVITNPECVTTKDNIDITELAENQRAAACRYIDSQPEIEALVASDAIVRTDILVTCPFVTYREVPVVPAQP